MNYSDYDMRVKELEEEIVFRYEEQIKELKSLCEKLIKNNEYTLEHIICSDSVKLGIRKLQKDETYISVLKGMK